MKLVLLLFFVISTGFAQEPPEITRFSSELFTGEAFNFENKSIEFKEVISDSRCPKDVTCVWAGEAKVRIELFDNGKSLGDKILVLGNPSINLADFFGENEFSLSALNLFPYPKISGKIKASEYQLVVEIEKS